MKTKILGTTLVGLVVFALATTAAYAWPDRAPDKAFISGPGIKGQVPITDPEVLEVLRLGGLEDMQWGAIKQPKVAGDGYKIIRYFEDGEFRMGDLTYYPKAVGARSVVYFEDGPALHGDRSPFNKKWLYATARGDAVLTEYLKQYDAAPAQVDPAAESESQAWAVHDELPEELRAGVLVTLGFTLKENHKMARVVLHRNGDPQKIVLAANAAGAPGHYVLKHTFPEPGNWNWSVGAFSSEVDVPMPTLIVLSDPVAPPAPAQPPLVAETKGVPETTGAPETTGDTQVQAAAVQSTIDPGTIALAVAAAALGILGIGAVLLQKKSREP